MRGGESQCGNVGSGLRTFFLVVYVSAKACFVMLVGEEVNDFRMADIHIMEGKLGQVSHEHDLRWPVFGLIEIMI